MHHTEFLVDGVYGTVYIMYGWYKSDCNPVLGSPFASPVSGDLSTP